MTHFAPGKSIATLVLALTMTVGLSGMSKIRGQGTSAAPDYAAILAAPHRSEAQRARDTARHPEATLAFFGLQSDMHVAEIWPGGGGWYLNVIAPALKQGGGTYYAVTPWDPASDKERVRGAITKFNDSFVAKPGTYGTIHHTLMRGTQTSFAPQGSLDMVLSFRNVHNWMTGNPDTDFSQAYMQGFFTALKSGGILGIVEHRAKATENPGATARGGYVQIEQVKAMAAAAGFEFIGASEVNANAKDTADHPFGVWTLPPTRTSAPRGKEPATDFDRAHFDSIGESDRMTLKFRKP